MRDELSEEQMRAMAMEKMGKDFSEEKFQEMMKEFKERLSRKDDFSYNQKGFEHRYDAGPSYEGYSKEQMLFSMVFENIGDDIDPREIKDKCNEPDKIADIVISKLKAKIGDIQSLCKKIENHESNCEDSSKKMCATIGAATGNANEMEKIHSMAFSCPVNKEAIVQACILRNQHYLDQQMENVASSCEKKASSESERMKQECEKARQYQLCDKDKFIERCMSGVKKENSEHGDNGNCGEYRNNGEVKKVCASCGNGICEPYETCTSSSCTKEACTNDCGPLYCPKDCQETTTKCAPTAPAWCPHYECVQGAISVQNPTTCCYECKPQGYIPPHCKETDNGYDIYTKGITYPDGIEPGKSDVCINDKTLAEYGCNTDGSYGGDKQYTCEFGCKDGACLRSSVATCQDSPMPICASGQNVQKKTDDKGCVSYYCSTPICQEPSKPTCSSSQTITTKYDSNNCPIYECVTITTASNSSGITGAAVLNTYDDYAKQCEFKWSQQEKICKTMQSNCDSANFAERCKEQSKKSLEELKPKIEENCKSQTQSFILAAEDKCSRIGNEKSRCLEETSRKCAQMKGLSEKCMSTLTEDNLRKFIIEEAKKRCKFSDKLEDRDEIKKSDKAEIVLAVLNTATQSDFDKLKLFVNDLKEDLKLQDTTVYRGTINPNSFADVKLLPFVVNAKISTAVSSEKSKEVKEKIVAGQKAEDAASKLVSLRDSDVPSQYLYIIEDKASDVLNVSDKLKDVEKKDNEKGFGYKMKLFFGLAKKAEQEEIKQLQDTKEKLNNSIDALAKLSDEVPSDVAKSILKEQVESLKKQQEEIDALIQAKEKKSRGLLGLFG